MKLIVPTHHSRAIQRISDALALHAPKGAEVARIPPIRKDTRRSAEIPGEADGDVVVLFANGLRDHQQALADRCVRRGQRVAVWQIALRTTRHPSTEQWRDLWARAAVVATYYPLDTWVKEDGGAPVDFNFLHAPLGVDASVFTPEPAAEREFTVMTSGQRRSQESVAECDDAAHAVGGRVFQLGPVFGMRSRTLVLSGITDPELAGFYRRCRFVSGLRRHEGFELPAAEGLLCGARPVLYDQPHYRGWFGDWAEYVQERDQESVTRDLTRLFERGPRPVSAEERTSAATTFDWAKIARGFWAASGVK